MIEASRPANEPERLRSLEELGLLDTPPEERFDRVTRLARRLFNVPIALVSLVDGERQWFKSRQGLDVEQTARSISFCGHAVVGRDTLVVEDAHNDARFDDNPLVRGDPGIRFYAGQPLATADGSKVGTLCLIDRTPRTLSSDDLQALHDLAAMVESEFTALRLASTDALTGLSNRRGFEQLAKHVLAVCDRATCCASLLYFDLNGFKAINDRFGHEAGDRALSDMAQLLLETFRDSDVIARLGGDEFCVLLASTAPAQVEATLARFAAQVDAHNAREQRPYVLSYSVGVSSRDPARHRNVAELLRDADQAMYLQKQHKQIT